MRVAYWNINTGPTSSQDRINVFLEWVQRMQPELLFLEEVGVNLAQSVAASFEANDMQIMGRVSSLDRRFNNASALDLWAVKRVVSMPAGFYTTRGTLRFPGLSQRRASIKATAPGQFSVWGIHANASTGGGTEATQQILNYLSSAGSAQDIVGGDINLGFNHANAIANNLGQAVIPFQPLSWNGLPLTFTQWRKDNSGAGGVSGTWSPNPALYLTGPLPPVKIFNFTLVPNDTLDFVFANQTLRMVVPEPNCPDEDVWVRILREFDHCPVVYQIT